MSSVNSFVVRLGVVWALCFGFSAQVFAMSPGSFFSGNAGDQFRFVVQENESKVEVLHNEKREVKTVSRGTVIVELLEKTPQAKRMKLTFEDFMMSITSEGGTMHFDSRSKTNRPSLLAVFFEGIIGQSIVIHEDQEGKVEVEGVEAIKDRILGAAKLSAKEKAELKEILGQFLSADTFGVSFGSPHFPATPLRVGATWSRSFSPHGEFGLGVLQTNTVKSHDNSKSVIVINEVISPDFNKIKTTRHLDVDMRHVLRGRGTGTLTINHTGNQEMSNLYEQRLSGHIECKVTMRKGKKTSIETVNFPVYTKTTSKMWGRKIASAPRQAALNTHAKSAVHIN